MIRAWIIVAVIAAAAVGGIAVTGLPSDVPDDVVIVERPATDAPTAPAPASDLTTTTSDVTTTTPTTGTTPPTDTSVD